MLFPGSLFCYISKALYNLLLYKLVKLVFFYVFSIAYDDLCQYITTNLEKKKRHTDNPFSNIGPSFIMTSHGNSYKNKFFFTASSSETENCARMVNHFKTKF